MTRMKTWMATGGATVALAAAAVAVPLASAGAAPVGAKSSSSLTSFHGTVTSVSTANRTFRLKRASGATLTFRVTSATVYERLSGGLSSLRGKAVEVKGRRADGRWTARKVERDDDGAADDNGGGGSDDGANHDATDDHGGSGGGGSDDGASHDAGDDHGGDR